MAELEAWRGRLQAASFRGVPFHTASEGRTGGRRITVHEFPERDIPYSEDHGRKARRFTLQALLIGSDYDLARDRLIRALEEPGPGELVTQRYGAHRVVVDSYSVSATSEIGRVAQIDVEFVEAGQRRQPAVVAGTGDEVLAEASEAEESLVSSVLKAARLDRVASWIQDSAVATWTEAADRLTDAIEKVRSETDELSELEVGARVWADEIAGGIVDLERSAMELAGFYQSLAGLDEDPSRLFGLLVSCREFSDPGASPFSTTESRVLEAANRDALEKVVTRATALAIARVGTEIELVSAADGEAIQSEILEILDAEISAATLDRDDEVSESLRAVRRAVVADFKRRIAAVPAISAFTPRASVPAVVLSQRFYGSPEYADEIASRNHISHPGFVPGGVALEVLERAG